VGGGTDSDSQDSIIKFVICSKTKREQITMSFLKLDIYLTRLSYTVLQPGRSQGSGLHGRECVLVLKSWATSVGHKCRGRLLK